MHVESDQSVGKPSRKQGQRPLHQKRGSQHERLAVQAFECQETVSLLRDPHRE